MQRFVQDEHGLVITTELVMIITIVVLALSVGWEAVATLLTEELEDVANAIGSLDQSYSYASISAEGHASCSGSSFSDTPNSVNITTSFPNFSGLIPNIPTPVIPATGNQPRRNRAVNEDRDEARAEDRDEARVENRDEARVVARVEAITIPCELRCLELIVGTDFLSRLIRETSEKTIVGIVTNIGTPLFARRILQLGADGSVERITSLGAAGFAGSIRAANPDSPFDPHRNGVERLDLKYLDESQSPCKSEGLEPRPDSIVPQDNVQGRSAGDSVQAQMRREREARETYERKVRAFRNSGR
jgi:hypothetical protein